MSNYKTRDPVPKSRDPAISSRDPVAEAGRQAPMRLAVTCVPEGQTKCPKCGYPISRITNTKRYTEFTPQVVIRYRDCAKCKNHFASRSEISA
jgi:hypothetical protein